MFNANQEVNQTIIDKRILPTSGLITVNRLMTFFSDTQWKTDKEVEEFVAECERNDIFVFKVYKEPKNWLVCLDGFRNAKNITV